MTTLSNQLREAGTVVGAADAVGNFKALAIDFLGGLAAVLVFQFFRAMAGDAVNSSLSDIGLLLSVITALLASNAAGVVLMDQIAGGSMRSVPDALLAGAFALLKGLVVFVAALLGLLMIVALVAALLFVSKMPGLGPVLFFVVFPVGVVVLGVSVAAFLLLLIPVTAPAIWSGESIAGSLARVIVVVRQRLLGVLIRNFALVVVILIAGVVLFGILVTGTVIAGAMSAGILDTRVDASSLGSLFGRGSGGDLGSGRDGYVEAGLRGGAMLLLIALTLPWLMLKKGWCLIYRDLVQSVDVTAVEAEMRQRVAQMKQKASEARERVQQQNLATRAVAVTRSQAGSNAGSANPAQGAPSAACPACRSAVTPADIFCGNCGHRLK